MFFVLKKNTVRKSIRLRTFIFYKESIILIVRLSFKIDYERIIKPKHFYERVWVETRGG